ncbi:competence protein [Pontibacillus litoralis JSM 072002]|uniref:Competence protein n=2 Tax=Pontibacillus TaxID=289201 RepID=A0A0A5GCE5_9BACI|nr:competence type IV pilus ATPase ComGA [Pontibacillus litoralis]KGX88868.1 competence protein [Pontibacillus litoralis JSM 072002]
MNAANQSHMILASATSLHASDIHFCPYGDYVYIYYRIHGVRHPRQTITLAQYTPLLSYLKFISGMDIGEMLTPQNGVTTFHQGEKAYALRLSTLPIQETESLAIRILPQQQIPNLDDLFLFPYQLQRMKAWISHTAGLILLTGPTGCGKTTTLYALLQAMLRERSFQTITLEDPIENQLEDILQVQVNEKAGMDYNAGLKAALRHDPDIIMVGEIRDAATAHFAIRAAQTGHLVLSSLHAKNAYGTIFRLLEMGIKKTDLQQTLLAVASQQLIPLLPSGNKEGPLHRAAIAELLEGHHLEQAFQGISPYNNPHYPSFDALRRKAYALGFIDQATL